MEKPIRNVVKPDRERKVLSKKVFSDKVSPWLDPQGKVFE